MAQRSVNNRNIILSLFQEHGPCTVQDIIPLGKKAGVTLQPDSYSACITQWYNRCKEGWQYLHRIKVPNTHAFAYEFDGATERKNKVGNKLAKVDKKTPKPAKASQSPPTAIAQAQPAMVLILDDDFVLTVTADRRVIQGTLLEPIRRQ